MKTELMISWRYLVTKRKEKFISLINIFSVVGIAIGVMALILVMAVMSGFDNELRDKIIGNFAHIVVLGCGTMEEKAYKEAVKTISATKGVKSSSPYVQGQVFINDEDLLFVADLKGIDPEEEKSVTNIKKYIISGKMEDLPSDAVIIGKELSVHLGLVVGSYLSIYSPQGKQYRLKIAGIFDSGMYDYNFRMVFVNLITAQNILGMSDKISGIALKLNNLYQADKIQGELSRSLGANYIVKTWMQLNENFFVALKLEKITMFIILALIVLVASFNIASTLIVMVVHKTKDIGILKAIGATSVKIRKIFIYEGLLIGTLGVSLGACGGLFLCYLLKKYQFVKLPSVYSIERLPVSIVFWPDIIVIISAAIFITLISTIYPAVKAGNLKPVEALRYE